MVGDKVDCEIVSTDPILLGGVAEMRDEPYLQVVQKAATLDCEAQAPNPLAGNRDTRRGMQRPPKTWMKKTQVISGPSLQGASVLLGQPSSDSLQKTVEGQGYNLRPNRQSN
ncbi:hypothetical protein Dimus_011171 [Dionaea muscipula]